jgi:hypothetical protein
MCQKVHQCKKKKKLLISWSNLCLQNFFRRLKVKKTLKTLFLTSHLLKSFVETIMILRSKVLKSYLDFLYSVKFVSTRTIMRLKVENNVFSTFDLKNVNNFWSHDQTIDKYYWNFWLPERCDFGPSDCSFNLRKMWLSI